MGVSADVHLRVQFACRHDGEGENEARKLQRAKAHGVLHSVVIGKLAQRILWQHPWVFSTSAERK